MKTQYETILVKNHDRWVRLILNRPDVKNALSEKMTTELLSVLANVKKDKNIRGVRVSPNVYTSLKELDILVKAIKEFVL